MEADSRQKVMQLLDTAVDEHAIEFENGRAAVMICPTLGRREIAR